MVRWWQVRGEAPSGLKLNRAWHVRQLLFALLPPAGAFIMLTALSRWDEQHKVSKVLLEIQQRAAKTSSEKRAAGDGKESPPPTLAALMKRIEALEGAASNAKAGAAGVESSGQQQSVQAQQLEALKTGAKEPVACTEQKQQQQQQRESSMQRRRREHAAPTASSLSSASPDSDSKS